MLIAAKSLRDLSIGSLMRLYEESNLAQGKDRWPHEPEARQLALAEEDAIEGLRAFFWQSGAELFVWQEDGVYRAALRLEPYRDGFLLTGLETAPADRGRGYAALLLRSVLAERGSVRIYSHIFYDNTASLRVHEKCGFVKISDTAAFLDGSVSASAGTYAYL